MATAGYPSAAVDSQISVVNLGAPGASTPMPTATPTERAADHSGRAGPHPDLRFYGDGGCFGVFETVKLETGQFIPISEVKVGDRVLSADANGEFDYADVVAIPHGRNDLEGVFLRLTMTSGRDIKMTRLHMLPVGKCASTVIGNLNGIVSRDTPLKYAYEVAVGDCLYTLQGLEEVAKIEMEIIQGLYSVVTMDEYVVVNGVVASPFAVSHTWGNAYYNLHRILHRLQLTPGYLWEAISSNYKKRK
jgi:Hint module